jgi:hypothetical protein
MADAPAEEVHASVCCIESNDAHAPIERHDVIRLSMLKFLMSEYLSLVFPQNHIRQHFDAKYPATCAS